MSEPNKNQQASGIWSETFVTHSYDVDLKKLAMIEGLCRRFQEAAWNHAEHLGVGFERLQQEEKIWVMSRLFIKVDRMPRWGESVSLQTWPRPARALFALRDFEMSNTTRLAAGTSAWLILDARTRKPQRLDRFVSGVQLIERMALGRDPDKVPGCDSSSNETRFIVRYSDLDVNGHVNHSRYVRWIVDSYSIEFHRDHVVKDLEINFLGELTAADELAVRSQQAARGEFLHSIFNCTKAQEVCRAKISWLETGAPYIAGRA